MNGKRKRLLPVILALMLWMLPVTDAFAADVLVPMGTAVGISLETGGVTVVGFSEVETETGSVSPAADAGMMAGDIITAIGTRKISSAADFLSAMSAADGAPMQLQARRNGTELLFHITPAKSREGCWQLGLWLRDGISGIGTVTYYDPETGAFGALGHGINDAESGKLLPFQTGSITRAEVVDVVKGSAGAPGELCGQPDKDAVLGTLEKNTGSGIFGTAEFSDIGAAIPVAEEEEIKLGPATILSTVSGGDVREYSIEISRIYRQRSDHRFLLLTITDPALLMQTGGIVQGMSGSPILQDGKLVGAVTHVLLSDASKGYGISIEDMLKAAA